MPTTAPWPVWSRFLIGAFILYSALLCVVSVSALVDTLRHGWALKADDIAMQSLLVIFLPLLLLGLRKQRLASGLLYLATGIDLLLIVTTNHIPGNDTSAMRVSALLFLGIPMLGAAIFLHRLAQKLR